MSYALLRSALFTLDAERAHEWSLRSLVLAYKLGLLPKLHFNASPLTVMGIDFPNPVGLAAGMDKNGAYIDALAALGFGYIEIGTVTPRAQLGNPKPRLFRLPHTQSIINRMGFNNDGVDALVGNVKRSDYRGVLGINIGKNAQTPVEDALSDYLYCLRKVYPYASYIVINISSPNTKNLRDLQEGEAFDRLLLTLKTEQQKLALQYEKYVPLVVKIAPDLNEENLHSIAKKLVHYEIDGVISSNTTLAREGVENDLHQQEAGGLSGQPLLKRANQIQQLLAKVLGGRLPIIGSGGIMCAEDAVGKIKEGASLVQLYSGMVYRGPRLISECIESLYQHRLIQGVRIK